MLSRPEISFQELHGFTLKVHEGILPALFCPAAACSFPSVSACCLRFSNAAISSCKLFFFSSNFFFSSMCIFLSLSNLSCNSFSDFFSSPSLSFTLETNICLISSSLR
uniref:Uncharacterized protein n=1 Tax=Ciona savignyi TaxID=51511 RepID=H2YIP8_CIOSA